MMEISEKKQREILEIIRRCGSVILSAHDIETRSDAISVKPGAANFVTEYDLKVQQTLIEALSALFPGANFFAEEKENSAASFQNAFCFVIDPIDGTTNFIHDMKCSAVSVALYYDGEPVFGAVYDPYLDEMFHATAGGGAYLNDVRIDSADRNIMKSEIPAGGAILKAGKKNIKRIVAQ